MKVSKVKVLCLALLGLGAQVGAKATIFTEQMFTTDTLFIEAEDADYNHGQTVTGQKIGMDGPYPGGAYLGLGTAGDLGFDWQAEGPNGQTYRANTGLSAGKEKGSGGSDRGTFQVTDWWTLGWNAAGDWENYTRTFPPTQNYIVVGHLASGGNAINIELDQVTAGFGQAVASQTTQLLGYFSPGRGTAGWDSLEIFPLVDANTNLIVVSIPGGTNTVRVTMQPGSAEDMDYFAFIPAKAPLYSAVAVARDQITASLVDIPSTPPITVNASTLSFTLNGNPVSGTPSQSGGITTVNFSISPLLAKGSTNTLVCTFKDSTGTTHTDSATFVVNTSFTTKTIFIEAEDADYSHGLYDTADKIGVDGPYPGGSYNGLGDATDLDYDWHATGPNGQAYRPNTGLSAGKENGSAGNDRGYFQVTDWWTLGWNNGGDWENYTRPFPNHSQWYEVYGHLASGGAAINIRVDKVTGGWGDTGANQTTKTLGYFAPGRATAGWDSLEIFPLITGPGGSPTVVNLSGTNTIKINMIGQEDCDYYAFVPVTLPAATLTINTDPQSATVVQGNSITLTVDATTTSQYGIGYQWNKNGQPIPNANSASYATPLLDLPDSGTSYTVDVTSPGASDAHSKAAVITVIKDTTPPVAVSAGSLHNQLAGTEVGVIFNKPLNAASATTVGNYSLDHGATVSAVRYVENSSGIVNILPDGTRLPDREQGAILSVSSLTAGTSYNLTIQNVTDYLGNAMTSQSLPVALSDFSWVSLGNTATNTANPNGVENDALAVASNGFNLVNGGNAFWGTEDDITMVYESVSGDFDKTAQVEWNDPSSNWARSGISARVSVAPADAIGTTVPQYQMIISDPETKFDGSAANDQYETNRRLNQGDATTSNNGGGKPHYPNSYVRLKRVGQMISMFWSANTTMPQSWMPLGTTDFGDTTVVNTPLPDALFVGPTLGVENGNITGQGGTPDQMGAFTSRIRNYGDMPNKARGKAAYAVGLKFGANEAGSQLSAGDVAGVNPVAQGNWNNIFGNTPTGVNGLMAEKAGKAVATTVTVDSTGSGNTWSSHGPRGEEDGALLTGNDSVLMTGYLDTGSPTTTTVTLGSIPSDLTSGGYDVVIYGLGGIGGRGGAYHITDASGNTLYDWVKVQGPMNPTDFIQVVPDTNNYVTGTFLVFTNLKASSIIVEATTDHGYAFGGTPRCPINAIQLVSPSGLLPLPVAVVTPTISIAESAGGAVTITFTGVLQMATTVNGTYAPVAGAVSPYTAPSPGFFRASSQ